MANDIEVSVGFQDIQTLRRELVGVAKDAKSSASVFEREYNKVERTLKATAKANQSYYASVLSLDKVTKSASKSAAVFEQAIKKEAVEVKKLADADRQLSVEKDRLAKSFVPLYAQSKLYEAELERLNRAQALGVISDKQRQASLAALNTQFAAGTGMFSKYAAEASRRTNQTGVAVQQLGYQVGDFAVQVQGGTNAFVAFGQQATQLVGVLPLVHAQLGMSMMTAIGLSTGLGIAIPIITGFLAYWSRTNSETDKAAKSLTELEEKIKSINATLRDWTNTKKASTAGVTVEEMFGIQNIDQAKKAVEGAREALSKLNEEVAASSLTSMGGGDAALTAFLISLIRGKGATKELTDAVEELTAAEKTLADLQTKQAEDRLANFEKTKAALQQDLDLQRVIATFGKDSAQASNLQIEQRIANYDAEIDRQKSLLELTEDQAEALKLLNLDLESAKAKELKDSVGQAYLDAVGLGKASVDSGINKAAEAARVLAERMNISLRAARDMLSLAYVPKDYSNLNYGGSRADARMAGSSTPPVIRDSTISSSGGGGAAGKVDTQEDYLAKLVREYDMKKKSLGLTDQQIKRNEFLFTIDEKIATMKTKASKQEIETARKQALASYDAFQAAEQNLAIMETVKGSLESMFMSILDGTKSIASSFKSMIREILLSLAQKNLIQPLVSGLTGGLAGGLAKSLAGGAGIAGAMGTIGSSLSAGFMTSVYGGLGGTAGAVSGGLATGGAAGIATAIGAVAAPLLAVAAVFSLFNKKVTELDSGISATVNNMESYVEAFSTIETSRFWGLSKKTSTSVTGLGADNPISAMIYEVQNSIFNSAKYLGAATDSFKGFSYNFKLSLKGLTEEAKLQKVSEEITKLGDAFASMLPNIESMAQLTEVMDQRYSLETRLLELQGNTQALRDRELATTHEYNKEIQLQIYAAEDAASAMSKLNTALSALKENDFATMLGFNRAQAAIRVGLPVANSVAMPNTISSGANLNSAPVNQSSSEISQLRNEMKEMHKEAMFAYSKLIKNSKDSRDTLRGWDIVGIPPERTA